MGLVTSLLTTVVWLGLLWVCWGGLVVLVVCAGLYVNSVGLVCYTFAYSLSLFGAFGSLEFGYNLRFIVFVFRLL